MALVRFLVDYQGVLTGEQWYAAGSVVDIAAAARLVADGRAEYVKQQAEPVLAVDLDSLTVNELKAMARDAGVANYYRLKRNELIAELRED